MSTIPFHKAVEVLGEDEATSSKGQRNERIPDHHSTPRVGPSSTSIVEKFGTQDLSGLEALEYLKKLPAKGNADVKLYSYFIKALQPGEPGSCSSCGFPIEIAGGFRVEGLPGTYCSGVQHQKVQDACNKSLICIEQAIFDKHNPRRTESKAARVGCGELLRSYIEGLSKSQPGTNLQSPQNSDRLCANERCRKGPNRTREIVKSGRAKYCSDSCRTAVSRREGKSKAQIQKPSRKRRRDAKYNSHAERQKAYKARKGIAKPVTLTDKAPLEAA